MIVSCLIRSISLSLSKENVDVSTATVVSPKTITSNVHLSAAVDDDDDFISIKKRPKLVRPINIDRSVTKSDAVNQCLESIISHIESHDATCPICNQQLSSLINIEQREQHVDRCLQQSQTVDVRILTRNVHMSSTRTHTHTHVQSILVVVYSLLTVQ
jgi:hypothetical protein